jgi:hypothetical protein
MVEQYIMFLSAGHSPSIDTNIFQTAEMFQTSFVLRWDKRHKTKKTFAPEQAYFCGFARLS